MPNPLRLETSVTPSCRSGAARLVASVWLARLVSAAPARAQAAAEPPFHTGTTSNDGVVRLAFTC